MDDKRNCVIRLCAYLESLGIKVNIGKTKARGNKGIFIQKADSYRIDVSKHLESGGILSVILHEYAHFLHYSYDKSLKSLDFIFDKLDDNLRDELINITLSDIPKEFAKSLFDTKKILQDEIKVLSNEIKEVYPNFKQTESLKQIESRIKIPLKYLLKYDRVKIGSKIYSVDNIDADFDNIREIEKKYIQIKSKKRSLNRINSRINKLNKYYNNNSELFARFLEKYLLDPEFVKIKAPNAFYRAKMFKNAQLANIEGILQTENQIII